MRGGQHVRGPRAAGRQGWTRVQSREFRTIARAVELWSSLPCASNAHGLRSYLHKSREEKSVAEVLKHKREHFWLKVSEPQFSRG